MGLLDSPWWLRTLPIPGCVHAWPENGPSLRRRNSNIPTGLEWLTSLTLYHDSQFSAFSTEVLVRMNQGTIAVVLLVLP